MNYEIVSVEEKIVVGVSAVTKNSDPNIGKIIGSLWDKLYQCNINQEGVHASIKNKINTYAIGLYSDYADEDTFCVTAGNEVSKAENPDLTVKVIPAGKYAKFSISGNMQTAVAKAWQEIWQMDLDRSFTGDFEEYLNSDFENCNIDIYIALK